MTPQQPIDDYRVAVEAARRAKIVVVFAWSRLRPVFGLPGDQNKLIASSTACLEIGNACSGSIIALRSASPP